MEISSFPRRGSRRNLRLDQDIGVAPVFSIITVALNSAGHIRGAIESIVAEQDRVAQYIVIDGKSTDDTVAIVESYRPVFGSRLVVVSEKDNGLYDAMNKGIGLATGAVVGILNSDDRYLPGALAAVAGAFASGDADIIYGNTEMVHPGETRLHKARLADLRDRMSLGHPACFVRRAAYDRWGRFDTRYSIAADYDFLLRCYLGGARFKYVDRVLASFAHGGASSGAFDRSRREVYEIQTRQLGRGRATWNQVRLLLDVKLTAIRRGIGIALLGGERYERLRIRLASRFRQ